jgi:phosphoribosylanthranilate isomerase
MANPFFSAPPAAPEQAVTNFRVKVCGNTDLRQMEQLGDAGVQFVGLNFYHKSPRFALKFLKGIDVKKTKIKPYKIGVFVNASYDEVMNHIDNFGLDMVQLHGDETPYQCDKIANYISVIKTFRFGGNDHIEWRLRDYYFTTDMFLFDAPAAVPGKEPRKFDTRILRGMEIGKPFFLSGNIELQDAESIRKFAHDKVSKDLFAVDISNGFENSSGKKDMARIKAFAQMLDILPG